MEPTQIIYVTGLPQSGAHLLGQYLGQHPDIQTFGGNSPLCSTLLSLRHQFSHDPDFLAQLDQDFDPSYQRLVRAFQGFMAGWWADVTTPWVVDYHPDWLRHGETLQSLDPQCKILVCVRELGQILGAIEHQHQQTQLLDFPESLADLTPAERATRLFNDEGAVGRALQSLEGVQDYPEALQQQLYYVVFEDLITDPAAVMEGIFSWFQLSPWEIDPHQLQSVAPVRDRRHFKPSSPLPLETPRYRIPDRFEITLRDRFPWFYRIFYPGLI